MKRIINTSLIVTIFLLIQTSCSEEWLKPDPLSFYAPENVFLNKAGYVSALITLRKDLKYECYGNRHPFSAEWAYSDLACATVQADFRKNTPSGSAFFPLLRYFENVYEFIKNANVVVSRIDDIEWDSDEDRNSILGIKLWSIKKVSIPYR